MRTNLRKRRDEAKPASWAMVVQRQMELQSESQGIEAFKARFKRNVYINDMVRGNELFFVINALREVIEQLERSEHSA